MMNTVMIDILKRLEKIHLLKRNWKGKKMITMTNWWWLLKIKCISDSWEKLKDNNDDDNNLIYMSNEKGEKTFDEKF